MNRPLNDFLPDNSAPEVTVVPGTQFQADFMLITETDIVPLLHPRKDFSHKGSFGHALIIAGAPNTMGAAILAAKGCLYAGAGLTTAAIPESGLTALNVSIPEVMYVQRKDLLLDEALQKYTAIAIGSGLKASIGYALEDVQLLEKLIALGRPFVADADALTILVGDDGSLRDLPEGTILTPHVKEFDRIFGAHANWWERLQTARAYARQKGIVIVLKNQYTFIIDQQGLVHINSSGNPAMAQGGMGDVLTGIITAYLAQGYSPKDAALISCFLHGRSGDELASVCFNITASQLAEALPKSRFLLAT